MASESGWNMPTGDLMKGKKGLIMGVANSNSIAWGIASQLAAQGAELAFTYLGEGLERRVRPLAESVGAKLLIQADVTDDASMDAAFAELEKAFGTIDFVVHSVAFANKDELKGSFVDNTSRDSFLLAMNISAFSFVDVAKRASKLMPNGGSLVTMTYLGSERAIPNYNTMGVAKAALEAATRYIARDLGPKGIRCNAISAAAMPIMWKPASTWMTSPVVEKPRSEHSHRAAPATPSIEVSSFIADMARPWLIMPRPPEMPASDRVRMAPAEMALQRMPLGPRSRAI